MCSDFQRVKIKKNPDKVVRMMADTREYLPAGTKIKLDTGNVYEITGAPVGCGGGSILYPVQRLVFYDGSAQPDGFFYVLKECYPVSGTYSFVRNENGEIVPENRNDDSEYYLNRAQKLLLKEDRLSRAVYQTASRMIPTRESASMVVLEIPGKTATVVSNTVTVMESLSEKGRSITTWIKENRRFAPFETFRIVQQLLFALKEVHHAGYLHLDIQDGNVFLKGTLDQKDELVTLIDFGSARPMVDGRTAPIQDRVILTTPGFAAPEIMLHNDSTLQLGAETDIYSVGCLALYLLTGSKPETRMLLENRTGIFLKPNQLRRIKCPRHLIDRMQQILATALNREPQNRYHSVEEMLRDVTDLVEALRPYRTDLSAVKYDAFVCYKHGPIDSEAAVTLQRELENYRAPKGVSKSRKPFKRVFVDEGELSSCADFGQQIREALQNSGWLIVVCSEDTPNSPWVQLEIDTFLETHSRSRVLCVMTGGDEKISFPPQLKGNQTNEGEVLAADARGSDIREVKKKLRKDALLKIAAPMLGTTFDSLKQRHKLYQMQKIAATTAGILTVTAGFAAYAVNRAHVIAEQAVRIEQEYENALINESLFLVEQAEKRLNDNDPLGAMELALKALPSKEQDRPVLTEAEYVLGEALEIYTTPVSAINTASAVGVIDADFSEFFLTKDGKYMVSWENDKKNIQIFDTETFAVIQDIELDSDPILLSEDFLLADNSVVIPIEGEIYCVNLLTGEPRWSVFMDNLSSICVSEDGSRLVAFSDDHDTSEDSITQTISILSAATGDYLQECTCVISGEKYISSEIVLSPDTKWAAMKAYSSFVSNEDALFLVNLETGATQRLTETDACIDSMQFIGTGIAVIRSSGYSMLVNYGNYRSFFMDPIAVCLEFYDLESGNLVWRSEHNCYDICEEWGMSTSAMVRYPVEENLKECIIFTFLNQHVLLDARTGETIGVVEMSAPVKDILYQDDAVISINADGTYHNVSFQNERILQIKMFGESIISLCRNGSTFYIRYGLMFEEDNRILKYELTNYDDSYIQLAEVGDSSTWDQYNLYDINPVLGGVRAVFAQDNQVCFVDTTKDVTNIYNIPEQYRFNFYRILGTSDDCSRMYWESYDAGYGCYYLDLLTGEITKVELPLKYWTFGSDPVICDKKLYSIKTEYSAGNEELVVVCWDFVDGSLSELYRIPLCKESESDMRVKWQERYISSSLRIDENTQQLQFAVGISKYNYDNTGNQEQSIHGIPQQLICIDLNDGSAKITNIAFDFQYDIIDSYTSSLWEAGSYHWNTTGTVAAFGFDNCIYLVDDDGHLLWNVSVTGRLAETGFSKDNETLFVLTDDGLFSSYHISDGTLSNTIDLNAFNVKASPTNDFGSYWEYIDQRTLLIYSLGESFILDVSANEFRMKAVVDECVGYDSQNNGFYVLSDSHLIDNTTIGYFPRYSVDDLIQKANDILS